MLKRGFLISKNYSLLTCSALWVSFIFVLSFSGCSHAPLSQNSSATAELSASSQNNGPDSQKNKSENTDSAKIASGEGLGPAQNILLTPEGEITVKGVRLKNTKFDFPLTINSRVEFWVEYFLGKGRKFFEKYLERSEYFIPFIQPVLKQNGLPEDLVYLAMIESGFSNHAKSSAKAVGPWQFMSATAKRYGLMVNWWVDERRDTSKSTVAAVEYLRDLYNMFQSWELAAAAYNAGEAKVARAIQRFSSKDFWVISRQGFLRAETRDYVPKIIAAAILSKNRTQFGFTASTLKANENEAIAGDGQIVRIEKENLAEGDKKADQDEETLATLLEEYEQKPADEAELPAISESPTTGGVLAKPVITPMVSKKGELSGVPLIEFEIQSPADLLQIAKASGLSYSTVKSLNAELIRWCTPPNVANYRIKLPVSVKDKFLEAYNKPEFPKRVNFLAYRARSGETLNRVAKHFGIKIDPIAELNGVSPVFQLKKGTKVLLPIPNDRSRSLASLDVTDGYSKKRRGVGSRKMRKNKIDLKKRESARS